MDYSIDEKDMITPLQSGKALLDDIASTSLEHGQVAMWWLGQSGYAIKTASALFYVDLYLSEHLTGKYAATEKPHVRITHAPLRGSDLQDVRLLFSSHKHSDHLDPVTLPEIFARNPAARLVLPRAIVEHAKAIGLDGARLILTGGDETLHIDGLTVHVIPSAHPTFEQDENGDYPFTGFVFEVDGVTLYHSGDTLAYEGLAERLKPYAVDVAFLPINGTDERRTALKVPPNMGIGDALVLALALADDSGSPLVIPHHYDMFTFNTVDVHDFVEAAGQANVRFKVLQCGEKFVYSAPSKG